MWLPNRQRIAWALAFALCAGRDGLAQDTQSASRLMAAHTFLEESGAVDAMVAAMRANLPAQRAATPQLPEEFWTRFEARMVKDAPQLVDSIAALYARRFTRQELDALVGFYRSPVGRRLRDLQPSLVEESSAMGQRWGMRIGAEIGASLRPR